MGTKREKPVRRPGLLNPMNALRVALALKDANTSYDDIDRIIKGLPPAPRPSARRQS